MTDWMTDVSRRPYVTNSLKHRRDELRGAAKRCRRAFRKDYMGVPSNWLADAYEEAASVLDRRLTEVINASGSGEALP